MKKQLLFLAFNFFVFIVWAQQKGVSKPSTNNQQLSTNTYAVVIGISDYQDPAIPDLRFADKDAEAFANFLRSPAGGQLNGDHLKLLTNQAATAGKIASALYWLVDESKEGDQIIIYFSGHGDVERKFIGQPGFLLCWDSPANVYMGGGSIELGMLQAVISTLSIDKKASVLIITDACHSGKLAGSSIRGAQITNSNLARQIANEIKILSCQANEYSLEGIQWGGGRGAFSFHLVNGLYGLANQDQDGKVNLKELTRYLEDHVSLETAPEKQNPVVFGDKEITVSKVVPELLAQISKNANSSVQLFSPVENRGLEEEVFASLDSNIRNTYLLFKQKVELQQFFEPMNDCADFYFEKLIIKTELSRLHNSMRRNYAAALQDGAQQALNKLLNMERTASGFSKKTLIKEYGKYPLQLDRAAELLGSTHYLYPILKARMYYFEGSLILLSRKQGIDVENGKRVLEKLNLAISYQQNFPQVYIALATMYGYMFHQMDSMELYSLKASALAPLWLEPSLGLAFNYEFVFKNYERSRFFLEQALQIDSNSIDVLEAVANDFNYQGKFVEAERYYKRVLVLDTLATLTYINLGLNYLDSKNYAEAELQFHKAIQLDSTLEYAYRFMGRTYNFTGKYKEALNYLEAAVHIDSTILENYISMGYAYMKLNQNKKAEFQFKKVIDKDHSNSNAYRNLGDLYLETNQTTEAKKSYDTCLIFNPKNSKALYGLARIHARNSNINNAYSSLELAFKAGYTDFNSIKNEPDLKILQLQNEQWKRLIEQYFPGR